MSTTTNADLDLLELPEPPQPESPSLPPELLDDPVGDEIGGESFTDSPFWEEYEKRASQNRDFTVIVSDWDNERGSGKTTLSIKLARAMDQSDKGLTPSKATLTPEEMINAYSAEPHQSALILDEAEAGMNSRDAMTTTNKVLSKMVSMARVAEKYVIFNMPASSHIDKNILDLADYWILVQRRGLARVYELNKNPFEGRTYPTPTQTMTWDALDGDNPVYQSLTSEKWDEIGSGADGESKYISREDHQERVEAERKTAREETRDEIIANLLKHPGVALPQTKIGEVACLMSQSHVSNVKKDVDQFATNDFLAEITGK
ncbi:hypothetical protein [Halorussus pelagicus]|uniref:hypothetical protein n=1 Tax=Halorussus pelagicus TaxID=2505977 RepID=UPI000FFC6ED9|nr:hypothetical protein [Halorussus pelagicus]